MIVVYYTLTYNTKFFLLFIYIHIFIYESMNLVVELSLTIYTYYKFYAVYFNICIYYFLGKWMHINI